MTRTILYDEANNEWQIVDERGQVLSIFVLHSEAVIALKAQTTVTGVRERLERVFTDVDCVYMDLIEGSTEYNQVADALNHLEAAMDILRKMELEP